MLTELICIYECNINAWHAFNLYNYSGPVCPLPKALSGSRHVGSVNSVTCKPHEVGGGTATCQEDLTWTSEVKACKGTCINLK